MVENEVQEAVGEAEQRVPVCVKLIVTNNND